MNARENSLSRTCPLGFRGGRGENDAAEHLHAARFRAALAEVDLGSLGHERSRTREGFLFGEGCGRADDRARAAGGLRVRSLHLGNRDPVTETRLVRTGAGPAGALVDSRVDAPREALRVGEAHDDSGGVRRIVRRFERLQSAIRVEVCIACMAASDAGETLGFFRETLAARARAVDAAALEREWRLKGQGCDRARGGVGPYDRC